MTGFEAVPYPEVRYKRLAPEAVKYFCSRLPEIGVTVPHPESANIVVAELEEKIIGFIVLQLMVHTEPIYIDPAHRGSGIAEKLAEEAEKLLKEIDARAVVCIATGRAVEVLCEFMGMKRIEGTLYAGYPGTKTGT
jgi:GNAT superfamily N-acetyltransferase